jgi:DNA repair ATPase RecN
MSATLAQNLNAFAQDANARHKAMDRLESTISDLESSHLDKDGTERLAQMRAKLSILKSYN